MDILEKNRNIHKSSIAKFNGEYIKEIGDGTLAIFNSSLDAVNCAMEIRNSCCKEPSLQVRIGIHIGDIIQKDNDVFGDGVNIASRIEAGGLPGGIFVSERVYEDIKNKPGIRCEFIGEKILKNIDYPVKVFSITNSTEEPGKIGMLPPGIKKTPIKQKRKWVRVFVLASGAAVIILAFVLFQIFHQDKDGGHLLAGIPEKSIAVLPISNFTGNPDFEFFSSGVHDAMIGELGKIKELLVKSRTSTLRYQTGDQSIQQIARELGVHYVVEGSVVGSADSLQLIVQLIEAFPLEKHIWSTSYLQDWKNVLSVYREVTRNIAENIHIKLSPELEGRLEPREINPELYKAYARGIFYLNKQTPEGLETGMRYLNEAISIDSLEPLPYLGLAVAYSNYGHAGPAGQDARTMALTYAHKALALDSNLAEAHAVLAAHYLYWAWDFKKTEHALNRAIEINPNMAMVRYTNGWYALIKGQDQTAIQEMKKAIEIDPVDPICTGYLGWLYLWLGQYEQAVEQARKTLEINPEYTMAYYVLGSALAEQGKFEEAILAHQKGIAIRPVFLSGLGITYARAGKTEQALEIAARLEEKPNAWKAWGLSNIYATLGDKQKALQWIETAFDLRQDFIPWMNRNPYFKPLYNEPRFIALYEKIGLKKYQSP
jgi:TolB-like protein/Flp pilus assembly protein TadD